MASVNKAIIVGNLGQDVDLKYTSSGSAVCNFSVATSYKRKNAETGDYIEETEWHRITAFGRTAEVCEDYLSKGSSVYIEGRLRTRKWTDDAGIDRYSTEIIAENVQFLSRKNAEAEQTPAKPQEPTPPKPQQDRDDDIPF